MQKVFILFVAIAFAATSFAQTYGGKAGVNFSRISVSEGDDFPSGGESPENRSGGGFHIGGFAQIEIMEGLNFRPELLYTKRSVSEDSEITTDIFGITSTSKIESDSKYSYLSLPLLAEYKVSDAFAAHLGPVVSFLMGANADFSSETTTTIAGVTTTESSSGSSSDTDGLNGVDLGIGVGATYELEMGLHFGARYNIGISNLTEENDLVKTKWGVTQISVGYAFMKP